MKYCDECYKRSYRDDVCTNCGLVFEDRPLEYSPLQNKKEEEIKHISLSKFRKSFNKKSTVYLKEVRNQDLKRSLRKYYYSWSDKRAHQVKEELKRITSLLNLGKSFYTSCFYAYCKIAKYNKKNNKNLFRGPRSSITTIAQGIAYLEIKKYGLPITLKDFEKINCNKRDVSFYYKKLLKEFKIKIVQQEPIRFINRIVVRLKLEPREEYLLIRCVKSFVEKISRIEKALNLLTQFKNPINRAGSFIYLLVSSNTTQNDICEITNCNVQTLRKRINEIKTIIEKVFSSFSVSEEDYDSTCRFGEYKKYVKNLSSHGFVRHLCNCLINPKIKMSINADKRSRIKPFFTIN